MKSLLSSLLLVFLVFSCAQKPKVETWRLSDGTPKSALFVMDVNLDPGTLMGPQHECELVARYHDGNELKFKIRPGSRRYFWSAPEGRYEMMFASCGMFTRFDMSDFPVFTVKNGESYYFGQIEMTLADRESLSWGLKAMEPDTFLVQFLSLPENLKHQIFSPFSRKQITEEMIKNTPDEPTVNIKGHAELAKKWQSQWPLADCLNQEKASNPLSAGLYKIELNRRYGRAAITENEASEHLYSPEFQACAVKVMQSIEFAQGQDDVQITLSM